MSHIPEDGEQGIQYIFNDTEFVLEEPNKKIDEEMNDIIYTDGNEAFVVNGHFFQGAGETPTLVLQEGDDINQYLINDDKGELLLANIQDNQSHDAQQIIQYVDEDGNITDPPEIVYINEEAVLATEENSEQYNLTELINSGKNPLFDGDQEQEETEIIDLESLLKQQNEDGTVMELDPSDWYQYAVVKDNDLHYAVTSDLAQATTPEDPLDLANVSEITGKNLLTGQVVTLEGYMDRIQKKIKTVSTNPVPWKRPKHNLNAFLNKKFNLGVTLGGRRLVGKIIHVGTKEVSDSTNNEKEQEGSNMSIGNIDVQNGIINDEIENIDKIVQRINDDEQKVSAEQTPGPPRTKNKPNQIHVQTKLLSKKSDQFQRISKTLSGLMNMAAVGKQLRQKSMQIKIIDKYYDSSKKVTRNVFFISGYMESKTVRNEENEYEEDWTFVPDTLKSQSANSSSEKKSKIKYPDTIGLTIMTTYQNNGSFVKVILDDAKTPTHIDQIVNNYQIMNGHGGVLYCELCNCEFESFNEMLDHKKTHSKSDVLRTCPHCKGCFNSESSLKRHMATHKLEAFKCPVCSYSAMSETDLKRHSQTHPNSCDICSEIFVSESKLAVHKRIHQMNALGAFKRNQETKYYACEICKRTFSRQSNLQRHVDIHQGAEQLYRCAICGCSYHYISSLTRHIVQNHVQVNRTNFIPKPGEVEVQTLLVNQKNNTKHKLNF